MKTTVFILLIFSVSCSSFARELPIIIGKFPFSRQYILEVLEKDSSKSFDCAIASLTDSLVSDAYFSADVHLILPDSLSIEAGNRYRIVAPRWLGDSTVITPELFAKIPLQEGSKFEFWQIEVSAALLLEWCEENGLPFVRLEVDSLAIDYAAHTVAPYLHIQSGPSIAITFVHFEDNVISQEKLLLRESRVRLGSLYKESRIRQARRRLSQLEYLRRVEYPQIMIDEQGRSGLLVKVEENRLSRLDVVAGLAPAAEGESQTLTGLVDLQLLNLFGTGRRGKVYWQKPASGVQELALAWREPWIAGTPLRADLSFAQRVEDTLYVTRRYGVRAGYPVSATVELFGGLASEELLADSGTAAQLNIVPSQTSLVETGFVVDTRNHLTNPRGGLRFETSAATGARTTDSPPEGSTKTEFTQRRAAADGEYYRELFPFWILAVTAHGRATISDEPEIPASDLYKVGGARTLRGYREEQFLGSQVAWGSLEARYWLGPASRFALFGDFGEIVRKSRLLDETTTTTIRRAAYGVGMRLETGIGIWGVDYGIAGGTSPLNGQLHVSLLSLF